MSDARAPIADTWAATGVTNTWAKNAHRTRKPYQSRITNGSSFLPGIDGRSAWARRAKDVHAHLVQDRGGPTVVSEAETLIARRAAVLESELNRLELIFAGAGEAEPAQLCLYQTVANCQRRLLEAIGLERRARDVTPTLKEFIAEIEAEEAAGASDDADNAGCADQAEIGSVSHQPPTARHPTQEED